MTPLLDARQVAIEGRLSPANLAVGPGELVALVGPNGGGKTSLLRALAQVEDSSGCVLIDGESLAGVPPVRRSRLIGFLPATRDLVWPIAVRDLAALGLGPEQRERVGVVLDQLELCDLAGRRVDRLSTGERTRALMARLIAAQPKVMLLDEPLSNLDPYWVRQLIVLLGKAAREHRASVLVSLHDLTRLADFDRAIAVADGLILFDGTPDSLLKSKDFSRVFRMNATELGLIN